MSRKSDGGLISSLLTIIFIVIFVKGCFFKNTTTSELVKKVENMLEYISSEFEPEIKEVKNKLDTLSKQLIDTTQITNDTEEYIQDDSNPSEDDFVFRN